MEAKNSKGRMSLEMTFWKKIILEIYMLATCQKKQSFRRKTVCPKQKKQTKVWKDKCQKNSEINFMHQLIILIFLNNISFCDADPLEDI